MTPRFLIAAFLTALAAPAAAQTAPASTPASVAAEEIPVAIDTSAGRIVVALDKTHAPVTTANFLHYADTHRYDGESFYRAMRQPGGKEGDGLIQGGIRTNGLKLFPPIEHEPTSETGLHNVAGAISMANGGAGTARADFFILASDIQALDATPTDPGFAVFGHVTEGMDVVKKILASPVSATRGEGAMQGQMLDPPIKIIKVSRVKP